MARMALAGVRLKKNGKTGVWKSTGKPSSPTMHNLGSTETANACVLCLPCGRSAHLEAGWMKGAGKKVFAFIPHNVHIEPELMYELLDGIALNVPELLQMLEGGDQ